MTNKLPVGWDECKLEEICCLDNGNKQQGLNLPLLDAKFLRGKKDPEYKNSGAVLDSNDYVILVDGENSGEIFSIPQQGIMGSTFKKLKFSKEISVEYILYNIRYNQGLFRTNKKGAAIPHLNKELFKSLPINLPPLNEQKRIVGKIEEVFAKVDAGVEKLKSVAENLKKYRQSVLHAAFTGYLTDIKMNILKLEDVGNIVTGSTPSKANIKYYGKDYPFYKPTDLNAGYNTYVSEDNLSKLGFNISRRLPPLSVLVTCIGATIGKTGLIHREGTCNQQINAIIPHDKFSSKYVYFYCISNEFQKQIKENASATTLPILNKSTFSNLNFSSCSLPEQEKIAEEIEKRFAMADKLEEAVSNSLKQAKELKQSILKKAFEGRLVPQDPNDEPAQILLDRIKAEKSTQLKKRKRK